MKKVLFCLLLGSLALAQAMPTREDLVRIEILSPAQAKDLDRLGVVVNRVARDHCIAEASPELLSQLSALGYKHTTLVENISRVYYENAQTKSEFGQYLTYTQFCDSMGTIAANNPTICHLETLATTSTGKRVLVVKVSDNAATNEPEPAIIWDGNTHGDEKIGWAVAFEYLKYLLNNYGSNPDITWLVDNREIWICPMFNPDGNISSSRYNARNVDMNRNWGWMWGEEAAPGSSVMSEAEVAGLISMIRREAPSIWVSFHAGTEAISYPWSYTDYDTIPENRQIDWLSSGYSTRGNSYDYGQGSVIMYYINGSSKDLGYGALGMMAWSIEVHYTKTPPANEIDPTFVRNRDAMTFLCRQAGRGIQGTVTDSATGLPVQAQIWLSPFNWASYTEATNGDYHRFALPGTYSLTVAAPGYASKTISGVVVPNSGDSTVTVDVQLTPGPGNPLFGFQVIACSCVVIGSNRTYPVRATGIHDNTAYTLDNNKWIVLDMDQPIRNGSGNDFTVYRSSGSGSATVRAANAWNGPWTLVGTANGAQTSLDLGSAGMDSARYLYFKASGSFGLDAVEALQFSGIAAPPVLPPVCPEYHLTVAPSLIQGEARVLCLPTPASDLQLGVYDIQGRLVQGLALRARDVGCSIGKDLRPGVYFLRPVGETRTGAGVRFAVLK